MISKIVPSIVSVTVGGLVCTRFALAVGKAVDGLVDL